LEDPARDHLRGATSGGREAVNSQLVAHDAYAPALGDLVNDSMERVVLWHARVAVKPWTTHGFLFAAGYGVALLHGASTVALVAAATGMTFPDDVTVGDARFALSSRLHLADVQIGWEWHWCRHGTISIGIGATVTLSAHTHVTLESERSIDDPRVQELGVLAAAILDHAYTRYVRTPLLSSFVGYEFSLVPSASS
jgi:hypothetical protein